MECGKELQNEHISIFLTSTLSDMKDNMHIWLLDLAASAHISGNIDLFQDIHDIPSISIETSSRSCFIACQHGTIHITIQSAPTGNLPDWPITLCDVIYALSLKANLLSARSMMNANVQVVLDKNSSLLSMNNSLVTRGIKYK